MKTINQSALILVFLSLMSYQLAAQDGQSSNDTTKTWKIGGSANLNFSQSSFSNWAAGGDNNVGLAIFYKPFANYNKGKVSWENSLDMRYGKNKVGEGPWRKSDDLLELNSKLGINASKHWFYTAALNFRTQFDEGFASQEQIKRTSTFMAPGYLMVTLGMDFKPNDKLSVFISPLTARTTFVLDDSLSDAGEYGVDPGEKAFTQFGPSLTFAYKNEIFENVILDSKINALYEYASDAKFVFNWDMILTMKVNKFLSTTLTTGLIYDENILFDVTNDQGNVVDQETRWQFKEVLAIGITVTY